jgi:hypothetical protein
MDINQLLEELTYLKDGMVNLTEETAKDFFNALYDAYFNMELGELLEEAQAIP